MSATFRVALAGQTAPFRFSTVSFAGVREIVAADVEQDIAARAAKAANLSDLADKEAALANIGGVSKNTNGSDFSQPDLVRVALGAASTGEFSHLLGLIEDLEAVVAGGFVGGYTSLSDLEADLAHPEGSLAKVGGDENPENDGVYRKSGAAGTGSWAAFDDPVIAAAVEVKAFREQASRFSLWPDPWFRWSNGDVLSRAGTRRIYGWGNGPSNRAWEADYKHAYGLGAWKFDSANTKAQSYDCWFDMSGADEAGIEAGDVVSIGIMVQSASGQVDFDAQFFSALSDTGGTYTTVGSVINGPQNQVMDGTIKVLKIENRTVPSGAMGVWGRINDESTAANDFRVIAYWVVKGAAAGDRPPLRMSEFEREQVAALDIDAVASEQLGKADWAVTRGPVWTAEAIVGSDLTSLSWMARTTDFSGFGEIRTPPASDVNAFFLPALRQATGAGTLVPWRKLRMYARTGATGTADDAGATVVAYGELDLDPEVTEYSDLWVAMREYVTGDPLEDPLLTVAPGDWGDEVGVIYQVLDANGSWASVDQRNGTSADRVGTPRTYYVTTGDARTAAWSNIPSNPGIAIQFGYLTDVEDDYVPSSALLAAIDLPSGLVERIDVALTSYGSPKGLFWGEWRVRNFKSKLRMLERGQTLQPSIAFIGDSWTARDERYVAMVADWLAETYGDGGPGFIGLGFSGSGTISGNARTHLYSVAKTGTWASGYANGTSASPNVSNATSSSAGAKYTITAAGATAVLTAMALIWEGTADGVVRYRWDAGGWTSLNVQGSGIQTANLGSLPASADWVLEIEVVSGSVNLCGLDGKAATGVRVHKLGASGSRVASWMSSDATKWQAALALLDPSVVSVEFAVNEQAASIDPAAFGSSLDTFLDRIEAAVPAADRMMVFPCETATGGASTMAAYLAEAIPVLDSHDAALIDLQYVFGQNVADYEDGSARSWLRSDGIHPVDADDFAGIPDAVIRLLESR